MSGGQKLHLESCQTQTTEILRSGRRCTNWLQMTIKSGFKHGRSSNWTLTDYCSSPYKGTCVLSPWNNAADRTLQHLFWWSCDSRDSLSTPSLIIQKGLWSLNVEWWDKPGTRKSTESVTTTRMQRRILHLVKKPDAWNTYTKAFPQDPWTFVSLKGPGTHVKKVDFFETQKVPHTHIVHLGW